MGTYVKYGQRKTIKYAQVPGDLSVKRNVWQDLRVDFQGSHIIVSFAGRTIIDIKDRHIKGSRGGRSVCGRKQAELPRLMTLAILKKGNKMNWKHFLIAGILAVNPLIQSMAKEVVVYTSVDDVFARPIAEKFERQTGIKVKLVTDTEETKSTGLLNRLIAEKKRPRADVFWSGDPIRAAILKAKGVSTPYRSKAAQGLATMYSDAEAYWAGFSARARIILYNKNQVKKGQEPTSIMDLLNPEFKGRVCMANPLFGTTSMHVAAIFDVFGDAKAKQYFADLKNNQLKLLSSNGEVRRRVSAGDCTYGLTDTDDAYTALRDGKPVGVVFPDKNGLGTLIVPNASVLIANAPHPKNGKQFIDFLLSAETEAALAKGDAAQMPLREDVQGPKNFPALKELHPMKVSYSQLAAKLDSLSKGFLKEWVGSF